MCFPGRTYRLFFVAIATAFPCVLSAQNDLKREPSIEHAQPFPIGREEQQLSITPVSDLRFGAFYAGKSGGSVEIHADGFRSSTGSVVLLYTGSTASAAVFEIKCPSHTLIHVVIDRRIELRNASGEVIVCEPLVTEPTDFVSPQNAEAGFFYRIGARLPVPDASFASSGPYSGSIPVYILVE